jgi:hypothetical protein
MRNASALSRAICAVILALLLSLRLVGGAGYMPAFAGGRVSIVVCPGADDNAPLALNAPHHHHGKTPHAHGSCPYAAAASLGGLGPDWTPLDAIFLLMAALLLARKPLFAAPAEPLAHPPARGPPLPA